MNREKAQGGIGKCAVDVFSNKIRSQTKRVDKQTKANNNNNNCIQWIVDSFPYHRVHNEMRCVFFVLQFYSAEDVECFFVDQSSNEEKMSLFEFAEKLKWREASGEEEEDANFTYFATYVFLYLITTSELFLLPIWKSEKPFTKSSN